MKQAAFSLSDYKFDQIYFDLENKISNELDIDFIPNGIYHKNKGIFELTFIFIASCDKIKNPFLKIRCKAFYKFKENITFEEIPSYFYENSIAILFPYVRSFVSTVTLQANIPPLLLPTWNLTSLKESLKENTTQI